MKKKLKKEMKKHLRLLAKKHGVEAATALVTGYLGGLAAKKGTEPEPEPEPEALPPSPAYPPPPEQPDPPPEHPY